MFCQALARRACLSGVTVAPGLWLAEGNSQRWASSLSHTRRGSAACRAAQHRRRGPGPLAEAVCRGSPPRPPPSIHAVRFRQVAGRAHTRGGCLCLHCLEFFCWGELSLLPIIYSAFIYIGVFGRQSNAAVLTLLLRPPGARSERHLRPRGGPLRPGFGTSSWPGEGLPASVLGAYLHVHPLRITIRSFGEHSLSLSDPVFTLVPCGVLSGRGRSRDGQPGGRV